MQVDAFTPDELDAIADNLEACFRRRAGLACRELARRIRQDTAQEASSVDVEIRKGPRILGSCNIIVMPFAGWSPGDRARVIKVKEDGKCASTLPVN